MAGEVSASLGAAAAAPAARRRREGEEAAEGRAGGAALQRQAAPRSNRTAGGHPAQGRNCVMSDIDHLLTSDTDIN